MCGLVGMAGNLNLTHGKMMRDLLIFDTIRGIDSTGIATLGFGDKDIETEKELGGPTNLWDYGQSQILNMRGHVRSMKKVMIGHNRAATLGKVTVDNAHPFKFGDITGAHNGTLRMWHNLEGYDTLDVDSKAIFNTINLKGIDHCWKNFVGAAALTYWNNEDKTVNIIRNDERPLYMAFSEKDDAVFWASERWMLQIASQKHGIKFMTREDKDGKPTDTIFMLKPHFLHTFKPTAHTHGLTGVRELEKKSLPVRNTTNSGTKIGFKGGTTSTKPTEKYINPMWAKGLDKADKSVRGMEALLSHVYKHTEEGIEYNTVVFRASDGLRLELYPSTLSEYRAWEIRCASNTKLFYRISQRPRLVVQEGTGKHLTYRVGERGVVLYRSEMTRTTVVDKSEEAPSVDNLIPMYRHFTGLVSECRFKEFLDSMRPACSCISCNDPLDINDHTEIMWLGNISALCPTCAKEEYTVATMNQYQHP